MRAMDSAEVTDGKYCTVANHATYGGGDTDDDNSNNDALSLAVGNDDAGFTSVTVTLAGNTARNVASVIDDSTVIRMVTVAYCSAVRGRDSL